MMRQATTLVLSLTFAGSAYAANEVEATPAAKVLHSENGGRYVFGQISTFRSDQYMLDTKTGRLWKAVLNKDQETVLQSVTYLSAVGGSSLMPDSDEDVKMVNSYLRQQAIKDAVKSVEPKKEQSPPANPGQQ